MKTDPVKQLLITLVPAICVLIAMAIAHNFFNVSIYNLTRDPTVIGKIHPLSGIISNLGVLLWWSATTICFFTSMFFFRTKQQETYQFFLMATVLSTWLALDDLFQFHDDLIGRYLGFDESFFMIALMVLVLIFLFKFKKIILQTNFIVLFLALGFFFVSVTVDHYQGAKALLSLGELRVFIEDGSKWLGITCWLSYFAFTSFQFFIKAIQQQG